MIILFRVQTTFLPTKIQKSEGKTKGKLIFLLFFQSRKKSNSWILTFCWHSASCACRSTSILKN